MKKLGGTIAAIFLAVSFAGVSSLQPAAAQTAQTPAVAAPAKPKVTGTRAYDGTWSVSIATVNGTCPTGLRYPAVITNGRVINASGESYGISGAVYSSGGVVVTVSDGGKSATGRGRMTPTTGSGTWITSDRQCSGTWIAERRS
jgi:hypothetical protein